MISKCVYALYLGRCIDLYRYRCIDIDIDIYLQATLIRMNMRESCWEGVCFLSISWTLWWASLCLCVISESFRLWKAPGYCGWSLWGLIPPGAALGASFPGPCILQRLWLSLDMNKLTNKTRPWALKNRKHEPWDSQGALFDHVNAAVISLQPLG